MINFLSEIELLVGVICNSSIYNIKNAQSGVKNMSQKSVRRNPSSDQYNASLTREQFCFYEMRSTAQLLHEGMTDQDVISKIVEDNVFQYPTEKSLKRIATMCIRRLRAMEDNSLIREIAIRPVEVSKQMCLYAVMKDSRLVWDFMLTVIAEKYRLQDFSFKKADLSVFFMRLQEQDSGVAEWSPATIVKIGQVLKRMLIENGYLDDGNTEKLNPVLINRWLENAIREKGDEIVLPAFNYFL